MIDAVRIAAVAVGGLMAVGPSVLAAARAAANKPSEAGPAAKPASREGPTADAHAVLDIAGRLKAAGNTKGVELCHQLLEAMFQEPGS